MDLKKSKEKGEIHKNAGASRNTSHKPSRAKHRNLLALTFENARGSSIYPCQNYLHEK